VLDGENRDREGMWLWAHHCVP